MDAVTPPDPVTPEALEPVTPTAGLASYTGYLLRRAYVRAHACALAVLPPGTHPGEGAILVNLADSGPTSQQDLSGHLRVNRTIMVKLVDKLEAAGLVERQRNPRDRRAYALVVTPKGLDGLGALREAVGRGEAQLTAALTPDEHRRLNELLRKLLPDMEATMAPFLLDLTGFLLVHAHFRVRQRSEQALAPLGVEPRHFGVLAVLDELGPSPQQRLARELGVSGPAIVAVVDSLEQAGLVERQRNPDDRREYALRVTAKGDRRYRQARAAADAIQDELATQLGDAEDRELRALLRKLLSAPVPAPRRAAGAY